MTECERLIESGLLDPAFLREETRCGYHIDSKMKKLWALQIDLMKQIEAICKAHDLKCFLIGGGCIGAIRHKGFIPWDDDIDVALKRADYNIFIEKAQQELKPPYFLQTPLTDPSSYKPFIIMRNSGGTCISSHDRKRDCNNGILIHVFPLDGYENNAECNLFRKICNIKNAIAVRCQGSYSVDRLRAKHILVRIAGKIVFPLGTAHYYRRFNLKCTKLSKKYTKKIGVQYTHYSKKCFPWNTEWFDSAIDVPFEYTTLPVPSGYHEILSRQFGDYMQFPPEEERANKHMFEIEPDIPYKEYCRKKYGTVYKN